MKTTEVCQILAEFAPLDLAQDWDNVGLLVGDQEADCSTLLLTIDLTPAVLQEAIGKKVDLVLAYHPPLFEPISSVLAQSSQTESIIYRAILRHIGIYSMHTALDAARGGTNDCLAELCGAEGIEPFEYVETAASQYKVAVFVPAAHVEDAAAAMSAAGAGQIGDYAQCSFRIPGTGTFCGGSTTRPAVGQAGQCETVEEIRLEMVVPKDKVAGVIQALRAVHPYEEPAYDIYPLQPEPRPGIGRIATLSQPAELHVLVRRLKETTPSQSPQVIGNPKAEVARVAVCVGACGRWPLKAGLGARDCLITGEIRHHEALAIERMGTHAIALGHWASERPVLARLAERLTERLPELSTSVSEADRDPFQPA